MVEQVPLPTYETLLTEAIRSLAVDSGVTSGPAAVGSNGLPDATKSWAVNVHKNRLVKIIRGSGAGQLAVIDNNSASGLVVKGSWLRAIGAGATYVIINADFMQMLRDVFGGGADISAVNPLQVLDPKVGSLISYEGTTTANGAGDGSTLVCSDLMTKPDFDGNLVIITSGVYKGQARDINGVTTGGTVTPSRVFGGQIVSGTKFVVVGITTTPAEVAAIEAKLDHAAHGLAALKALIDVVEDKLDGVSGLAAIKAVVDDILMDTETTLEDKLDIIKAVTNALPDAGALSSLALEASVESCVDRVYFDSINGAPGTDWPIGTPGMPVNNETDLLAILTARKLNLVVLRNPATVLLFTGALADITFIGEGKPALCPTVDFNGKALTCTFINLRITDTAGDNLVSASEFWNCDILKVIAHTVGGANYHGCRFIVAVTNPPLGIINCYDGCEWLGTLTNTTGVINIYGDCHTASSISNTGAGTITIKGNCHVNNLSNTTGQVNILGNFQTGGALANTTGTITIDGSCQVGGNVNNTTGAITIKGSCQVGGTIYNTDTGIISVFIDCSIANALSNATGNIRIYGNCHIGGGLGTGLVNTTGNIYVRGDCLIYGGLSNKGSILYSTIKFTAPSAILDLSSATSRTERVVSRGSLHVANMVAGATAIIDLCGGTLTIDNTCTGGTIDLYGDCELVDLAGGVVTVNDHRTSPSRAYLPVIPQVNVPLAAIDDTLTTDPSAGVPDVENTIMDLAITAGRLYQLDDLILKIDSYGTGASMTIKLWELLGGGARANYVVTRTVVIPADYPITDYLNLMDLLGKPIVVGKGIAMTAEVNAGVTGVLSCTYNYSIAHT